MLLLAVTYVIPLVMVAVTYTRVGFELWGSKTIGERTAGQDETLRSKRKVHHHARDADSKKKQYLKEP